MRSAETTRAAPVRWATTICACHMKVTERHLPLYKYAVHPLEVSRLNQTSLSYEMVQKKLACFSQHQQHSFPFKGNSPQKHIEMLAVVLDYT